MVRFQIRLEKGRLESPSNARAGGRVTPTTSPNLPDGRSARFGAQGIGAGRRLHVGPQAGRRPVG